MKSRKAGGVGIALVAVGLLIGLMFKGPGLGGGGSGDGVGSGSGESTPDLTNVKAQAPVDLAGESAGPRTNGPGAASAAPPYVTVIIHGGGYRLSPEGDPATGVDVELDDIVSRVSAAQGTAEGIKLRMMFHRSAQEGARSDLLAALQRAGVKPESVQQVSTFVE